MSRIKLSEVSAYAGGSTPPCGSMLLLVLYAVMTVPMATLAGAARYATPVWSMGNYNSATPQTFTAATSSPRLAFNL